MRAAVLCGPMDMQVETFPIPEPGPGQAVIRVETCGVCPSGLKILKDPSHFPERLWRVPGTLGHEVAGTIAAAGPAVDALAVGERVVHGPLVPCGRCRLCRRGRANFCLTSRDQEYLATGFAQYMLVSAATCLPTPEGLSDDEASFAEPLACCLNSVERAGVREGDTVVIVGGGTMGLLHLALVRALGARAIVTELDATRLRRAAELGADAVVQAGQSDTVEQVRALTDHRGAEAVIVCVGAAPAIEAGLAMAADCGAVNLFAGTWPPTTIALDPNRIHYKELVLTGSQSSTRAQHERALALMAARQVDVRSLITHRMPLEEIMEAHRVYGSGVGLKVLVKPWGVQ
ncbi:MAG: alcohol dehydrogenase catalytic domain-containing protein [Anaerolineae bacterium]|nr:alcohol dehydrogenase catalytic domain-containing protein [Anaerolineae bacterium]